jgi:3-carboxy-cis,cis-muconate cycloisomerase
VQAMAHMLPGLQVDVPRMRANIDAVRAVLPAEAADEWFSPALAQHAAQLTHTQMASQRRALAAIPPFEGAP